MFGWIVFLALLAYGILFLKENISTLKGPVWDYIREANATPPEGYKRSLKETAFGTIQSVDKDGFVISMLGTEDPPPPPAGLSLPADAPVREWIVTADGGDGIFHCTFADKVLVEYYESSTSAVTLSSDIMPKAEATKLLKPGQSVSVGSQSGDATNIGRVTHLMIWLRGVVKYEPKPGERMGVNPEQLPGGQKHPLYMYRSQ